MRQERAKSLLRQLRRPLAELRKHVRLTIMIEPRRLTPI
jgi:hypothetical protein